MRGSYLGPRSTPDDIRACLDGAGALYETLDDEDAAATRRPSCLADEHVVGWFQGRMEFGPRALGGRSIIGDPRSPKMQSVDEPEDQVPRVVPAVRARRAGRAVSATTSSSTGPAPTCCWSPPVREASRRPHDAEEQRDLFGIDKLNVPRSEIPAITHVDYSARIQTVHAETNPRYHALLKAFEARTGCPVLVNTSFNVRGEPIVCTPEDAYRCFMRTEMDYLVIGELPAGQDRPAPRCPLKT